MKKTNATDILLRMDDFLFACGRWDCYSKSVHFINPCELGTRAALVCHTGLQSYREVASLWEPYLLRSRINEIPSITSAPYSLPVIKFIEAPSIFQMGWWKACGPQALTIHLRRDEKK